MTAAVQPFLFSDSVWIEVKDANPTALAIFHRHYSYKPRTRSVSKQPYHFVGPGRKIVLLTPDARALFVWRKFRSQYNQEGVNNAVFRNEGSVRSSDLIIAAMAIAWRVWPEERRLYTYVNQRKVRSSNPGYCFQMAGWRKCGFTKARKLLVLEYLKEWDLTTQRRPAVR